VDEIVKAAAAVYTLQAVRQNLQVAPPGCAHDFPGAGRMQAFGFLAENLR
jgi:hypothetical protein